MGNTTTRRICIGLLIFLLSIILISCKSNTADVDELGYQNGETANDDQEEKINHLLEKAKELVKEKNWIEAGNYLAQAKELLGEEFPLLIEEKDDWFEDRVVKALLAGNVFTGEDSRLFIEQGLLSLPNDPKLEILEKEAGEALNWFSDYRRFMADMVINAVNFYHQRKPDAINDGIIFLGESIDELMTLRNRYVAEGSYDFFQEQFYNRVAHFAGEKFFLIGDFSFGHGPTGLIDEAVRDTNEILDFEVRENEVFFRIYNETQGYVIMEGVYSLIFNINRKEDGTFRVASYEIHFEE